MNHLTLNQPIINQPTIKKYNSMETNQYFSFPRFWHLMQREFAQNKKIFLMIAAVAFLVIGGNALGWAYNREHGYHEFAYGFYLLVGGFILTSLSFTEMNQPDNKLFYLTLPATSLEKFISRWLITGLGFAVLLTIGYWLTTLVAKALGIAIFDFNIGDFNPFTKENILFFQIYLAVQTIFLLGAVYFRKFAIFKTVLATAFIGLCLVVISAISFRLVMFDLFDGLVNFRPEMMIDGKLMPVEPSRSYQNFMESNAESYLRLVGFWIIPAVLLVVGYFKLKETEL